MRNSFTSRFLTGGAIAGGFGLTGTQAMAHIGHLGEVAGHGHWLGAAAIGAAIGIGLWQGLRGKGKAKSGEDDAVEADAEAEEMPEETPQEA